jgi:hypothetical protein
MRSILFGMAACATGGAAWWAGSPGPDFDRVIDRPPISVYAAFSALGNEGSVTEEAGDGKTRMTRRITKVMGESLKLEMLVDDRVVMEAELHFAPGPDGHGTRVTGEFDVNASAVGAAFETEAGVALSLVPDAYFDNQFAQLMDEMADDVEAGRRLDPLGLADAGVRRQQLSSSTSVEGRRSEIRAQQRKASAPSARARPMVDPNQVARQHVRTNGTPREGSSRPSGY